MHVGYGQLKNIVSYSYVSTGGQTKKYCFVATFPEGGNQENIVACICFLKV